METHGSAARRPATTTLPLPDPTDVRNAAGLSTFSRTCNVTLRRPSFTKTNPRYPSSTIRTHRHQRTNFRKSTPSWSRWARIPPSRSGSPQIRRSYLLRFPARTTSSAGSGSPTSGQNRRGDVKRFGYSGKGGGRSAQRQDAGILGGLFASIGARQGKRHIRCGNRQRTERSTAAWTVRKSSRGKQPRRRRWPRRSRISTCRQSIHPVSELGDDVGCLCCGGFTNRVHFLPHGNGERRHGVSDFLRSRKFMTMKDPVPLNEAWVVDLTQTARRQTVQGATGRVRECAGGGRAARWRKA